MKLKLIRIFILGVLCIICMRVSAQDDYTAEIGGNIGGSYYLGDANDVPFNTNNMNWASSVFFRYCFNPRLSTKVEGTFTNAVNKVGLNFKNQVFAVDFTGEFNFFDLEKNEYKKLSKTFSPYIFIGVGMMNYSVLDTLKFTPSIPFGLGMKVKLGKRFNLNVQWTTRLLLADNLEGTAHLTGLNNSKDLNGNNLFNNDILSTFTVGISYDIWKKQCDCKNSSVKK